MKFFNNKVRVGDRVFGLINGFVMLVFAVIMIYPIWYVIVASLTDYSELMQTSGMLL